MANFATKFSPKVQEAFSLASVTEGLFSNDYDWTGVATVKVYSVDDLPLNDYDWDLTTGSRFGSLTELGDTVQELTVNDDKAFNGSIDKRNNTSELQIKAASKVMARQSRNVIVPYVDKYRLNALANGNGIASGWGTNGKGTVVTGVSLTASTALRTLMTAHAAMKNLLVPGENNVLYIGETTAIEIKLADQVVGTGATVQDVAKGVVVNGEIGKIAGLHACVVPDSYMPTVNDAAVQFMIVHKGVAVAPKKIETMRIIQDHPDIDGHVVQGRFLHDCFVLEKKAAGIYVATA